MEKPADAQALQESSDPREGIERNYTADGRYIPYSGGSAGWDDNRGVPKREMSNNYRYYQVMDSGEVRVTQFQRMGQNFDRRGGKQRVLKKTPVNLSWEGGDRSGATHDLSLQGVRLQFYEQLPLRTGDQVTVEVMMPEGTPLLAVRSRVVWTATTGNIRPLWNVGMAFLDLGDTDKEQLRAFLGM